MNTSIYFFFQFQKVWDQVMSLLSLEYSAYAYSIFNFLMLRVVIILIVLKSRIILTASCTLIFMNTVTVKASWLFTRVQYHYMLVVPSYIMYMYAYKFSYLYNVNYFLWFGWQHPQECNWPSSTGRTNILNTCSQNNLLSVLQFENVNSFL